MSGSLIDLTAKKGLGWLATVIQDLQVSTGREQTLLVGAQARDLLLHYVHGVPITRATTDYEVDSVQDLIPVCSNCHAMIHRTKSALTIEELKEWLKKQGQSVAIDAR